MKPTAINENIYWIGVNDTTTRLFEGLWLIEEEGVSYNSYLIKDEKSTLIDLCTDATGKLLIENIQSIIDPNELQYLVINHMEPDHSGAVHQLLEVAPQITILGSQKTKDMLDAFFEIKDNIQVVKDGETIVLGSHTLQFISTPMVHWPETIMTYETTTGTLFSCDGFGGYGKLEEGIFDDQQSDLAFFESEALRYYSNIVCAFSKPVLKAAEKLSTLDINMVAPSHGLIWRENPGRILELYVEWSKFAGGNSPKKVCLLFGSMYGNSASVVPSMQETLTEKNIEVETFNVNDTHVSYILPSLWTSSAVIVCAPTYEGGLFPTMEFVLEMAEKKRIYDKQVIYIGSYGWGGGAMRFINKQVNELSWNLLGQVEFKGMADNEEVFAIKELTSILADSL